MTLMITWEDNITCIAQLKEWYIKEDKTNHILPKFFFTNDLKKNSDKNVQQVRSRENLEDIFKSHCQERLLSNKLTWLDFVT